MQTLKTSLLSREKVQKLSRQIDDIMWETGCGDHDAEMIEMKSRNQLNNRLIHLIQLSIIHRTDLLDNNRRITSHKITIKN